MRVKTRARSSLCAAFARYFVLDQFSLLVRGRGSFVFCGLLFARLERVRCGDAREDAREQRDLLCLCRQLSFRRSVFVRGSYSIV